MSKYTGEYLDRVVEIITQYFEEKYKDDLPSSDIEFDSLSKEEISEIDKKINSFLEGIDNIEDIEEEALKFLREKAINKILDNEK